MRDWDACYRNGETPWDKGSAAPPLLELIERFGPAIWGEGPVLVPGCGMGHDVRELAARGVPVVGLDISETATRQASAVPAAGGEVYETGDFLDPGWGANRSFSAIWEHTCFCAIHPSRRDAYAASAAASLRDDGILAGVFYLTPNDPGEEDHLPPYNVTIGELDRHFAPWFERIHGWLPTRFYPSREGREWVGVFRKLPQARVAR
jgi:SAM-dependent methyltransferase